MHAPRAWAKRVLCWEIYEGNLDLIFASGTIVERRLGFRFLREARTDGIDGTIEDVKAELGDEIAQAVKAAGATGLVDVGTVTWEREIRLFPVEVIVHADDFDWEAGTASGEFSTHDLPKDFESDELSFGENGDYLSYRLTDMCFIGSVIEMMAPGGTLPAGDLFSISASQPEARKGGPGRRREYDWDGALLHLIGQAEKNSIAPNPDAHGAQADIKRTLADWFSANGGKVPADSQLQALAKRALEAIRSTNP